jgi:hypothetical protein
MTGSVVRYSAKKTRWQELIRSFREPLEVLKPGLILIHDHFLMTVPPKANSYHSYKLALLTRTMPQMLEEPRFNFHTSRGAWSTDCRVSNIGETRTRAAAAAHSIVRPAARANFFGICCAPKLRTENTARTSGTCANSATRTDVNADDFGGDKVDPRRTRWFLYGGA